MGAHVRVTGGMSKNPLSSRKSRWAPSFSAFFYMREAIPFPMDDLFFLSLQSSTFRLLATPTHRQKQSPDMVGVILNPEVLLNYLRDPLQGP
jgi:hypothetical protein